MITGGCFPRGCTCMRRKRKVVTKDQEELSSSDSSKCEETDRLDAPPNVKKHPTTKIIGNTAFRFRRLIPLKVLICFGNGETEMTKLEKTLKASLLIQKWYRRYMARLEVRRRCTWTIFQTLEYAGEQDQVKLYNFFNSLLTHIPQTINGTYDSRETSRCSSLDKIDEEFEDESPEEDFYDPEEKKTLRHFVIEFPYTKEKITDLIEIFRKHRHFKLPPRNIGEILRRSITVLKKLPNLNVASTALSKQITICGDLHGKFDDLLVILHKNGLPSPENPYVFNGDFIDRGKRGLEVLLVLLLCLITFQGGVYLNRGNHEDHIMNQRYGFIKEVQSKYKKNAEKMLKLIEGVYRWLPLGTIVNNKVLIVHGGISDSTDLQLIRSLERDKYVSLLRPPMLETALPGADTIDKLEWKQVFDILWSDPQDPSGCIPNTLRGAGTYFGPDITKKFLKDNKFAFMVRSHECKPDGYEVCHDGLVITIFSASNYYEVGSNNGAYLKLVGLDLDTHYVQYMANAGQRKLNFYQRMGLVESGATKELQAQILNHKNRLEEEFAALDADNTGYITITQWCMALEKITGLQIPWRLLKDKLVQIDPDTNLVKYQSTFDNIKSKILDSVQGASTVVETLYRNKTSLEAIFRIIDKDNSGYITLDELAEACNLIKAHMPCPMTDEQLAEICKLMDINKDGLVDLNEFLESFRMVDPESRLKNLLGSQPGTPVEVQKANSSKDPTTTKSGSSGPTSDSLSPINASSDRPVPAVRRRSRFKKDIEIEDTTAANNSSMVLPEIVIVKPEIHSTEVQVSSPVLSSRRGSQI